MTKLSAVIITANEAKNMHRCLASLVGVVDEIVVMDSFSTDATEEICKQYPVRFFQQEWKGYGQQKNDAHAKTSFDFILSIDADEELSEELRASILKQKQNGLTGVYEIKRISSFCGHIIQYGSWNPELKIRIFNKNEVKWDTREVHENLEIPSQLKTTLLSGPFIHYTSNTIEERVLTSNKYSTLGAKVYFEKGKKSSWLKIAIKPWAHFINGFIFRGGFLDGFYGFILAILLAYEVFLKYAKLYHLQKKDSPQSAKR